jgi:hypothetical protein
MVSNDLISSLIQTILMVAIQVLLPILLGFAVLWIKQQIEVGKTKLSKEQLDLLQTLAQQYVMAAEQTGLTNELLKEGTAKKEWVLARMESEVSKRGLSIDVRMLSDLVESEVYKAFRA